MRTRVATYDIRAPRPIWGMEPYGQLLLLMRDRERLLTTLTLQLTRRVAVLSPDDIDRLIAERIFLGASPLREIHATRVTDGPPPEISVVICTKDRPRSLDRCLTALRMARYPRYEVIVVDNRSRDEATADVAERHDVRHVREDLPGLDNARNRGIREARYNIVAFIDDDVQVDPGWLAGLGNAFDDPGVDAVTGLVLPLELETPAQNYFEIYGNGMNKGFRQRSFRAPDLTQAQLIAVQHMGVGANMAARKSALLEVGGFDPALDVGTVAGGAGDLDMFHRLLTAGKTIRYEPQAMVRHQHRRDMESLNIQIYNNGRSFGVYLLKLWRDKTVSRRSLVSYATWTWGRWLLGRLVLGALGRHRLPARLLWAELRGALSSPLAFVGTYGPRQPHETRPADHEPAAISLGSPS